MAGNLSSKGATTTVTTSATVVHTIPMSDLTNGYVGLEIQNTGATAFTAFAVQVLNHPDGTYADYITAWTAATSTLLFISANAATLAGGATAYAQILVLGAYAIRVRATVGSGTTTAIVLANVRQA